MKTLLITNGFGGVCLYYNYVKTQNGCFVHSTMVVILQERNKMEWTEVKWQMFPDFHFGNQAGANPVRFMSEVLIPFTIKKWKTHTKKNCFITICILQKLYTFKEYFSVLLVMF